MTRIMQNRQYCCSRCKEYRNINGLYFLHGHRGLYCKHCCYEVGREKREEENRPIESRFDILDIRNEVCQRG